MKKLSILATAVLMTSPVSSLAQSAPSQTIQTQHPLLGRVLQSPQHGPEYAFHMNYKDNNVSAQAFVDPSKPQGQRLNVTTPPRSEWSNDFREMLFEFDASPLDEFWCTDFLKLIGPDIRPVLETDNKVVFGFSPQPGPDDDADDRKFLSKMIAHLTIDRQHGMITKFEMRNRKPFKPIFIAKIKSFRMEAQCQASPDGRPYIAKLETSIIGKIALKKINEHETRIISNLVLPH